MVVYLAGCTICTVSYAITVRAAIGLGPLFAVQDGVSQIAHITLGHAVMVVGVVLLALSAAFGERPRVGTFAMPFIGGVILDAVLPHVPSIHGIVWQLVAVVAATWAMCLGGALVISSEVGMAAIDGVMMGLHRLTGRTLAQVRLTMELSMLVGGWLLGGAIGVGTVITGALVGPALQFWLGVLGRPATPDHRMSELTAAA